MKQTSIGGITLLFLARLLIPGIATGHEDEGVLKTKSFTSAAVHLDRAYLIMQGPVSKSEAVLGDPSDGNELWIKSFRVDITDNNGVPRPQNLCHAWANFGSRPGDQNLMSISQGMAEMKFPEGYGMPLKNDQEKILFHIQALNNEDKIDRSINYKMTLSYYSESDAKKLGLKALHQQTVMIKSEDAKAESSAYAKQSGLKDPQSEGALFFVPPGSHDYRSDATPYLAGGGTIHFIKLHLHTYGETVSLVDKTLNKVVWQGWGDTDTHDKALSHTDYYSSPTGITIDPRHQYEVLAHYNNPTQKTIDAMAVLRLYIGK